MATRLTIWYAASAFSLIAVATGLLYWVLVSSLDRADDRLLGDKVRVLRAVFLNRPYDNVAIRQEVEEAWEARRATQVYVRVLDPSGQVIAETPGMDRILPAPIFPSPSAEPGDGIDVTRDGDRIFRVLAAESNHGARPDQSLIVQVGTDRSDEFALLVAYRRYLFVVLGAAVILCSVVGYQIARRGLQPVHEITDTARRIRAANLHERLSADGLPDELLALGETFNEMLQRLEDSFTRISRFSADIAHELRTPLNNVLGEIEVSLNRPRSAHEYREVLTSALEECRRLARMTDDMLFLARAEAPQASMTRERLDLHRELTTLREFYEAAAVDAGVQIILDVGEPVVLDANRLLFQRAVINLLANALAHTPPGGSITVRATARDTTAVVEVLDSGCGIPAEHLAHVFDRFYRVDQARREGQPGRVGLGLSLVRSILDLHGGSVGIESELGTGTRVILRFPRGEMPTGSVQSDQIAEDDGIFISASSS